MLAALIPLLLVSAEAFVVPRAALGVSSRMASTAPLQALPGFMLLAEGEQAITDIDGAAAMAGSAAVVQGLTPEPVLMDKIMGALPTVAVVGFAIVSFFVGITYIFAAFIIPGAAKEVERQAKELDPALWDEYEAKLNPGETMAQRPDLMQELGNRLQASAYGKLQDSSAPVQTPRPESTASPPPEVTKEPKNTVSVVTPENEVIDIEVPEGVQVIEAKDASQWDD